MPHKRKKRGKEKQKKQGGEKAKGKRRKGSETFSLLSAHARTLKAVIWHQEQKLVQCPTCKQCFGQFGFFLGRQRPKSSLTDFKRHFLAKCPGVNGLKKTLRQLKLSKIKDWNSVFEFFALACLLCSGQVNGDLG